MTNTNPRAITVTDEDFVAVAARLSELGASLTPSQRLALQLALGTEDAQGDAAGYQGGITGPLLPSDFGRVSMSYYHPVSTQLEFGKVSMSYYHPR